MAHGVAALGLGAPESGLGGGGGGGGPMELIMTAASVQTFRQTDVSAAQLAVDPRLPLDRACAHPRIARKV